MLTVLLAGEAGLRCGEMSGLEWSDTDLKLGLLTVARSIWRGYEGPPKSGRSRTIPLAPRLAEALAEHRHLRGPSVLRSASNERPGDATIRYWLDQVQARAGFAEPHACMARRPRMCSICSRACGSDRWTEYDCSPKPLNTNLMATLSMKFLPV